MAEVAYPGWQVTTIQAYKQVSPSVEAVNRMVQESLPVIVGQKPTPVLPTVEVYYQRASKRNQKYRLLQIYGRKVKS